MRSKLSRLAGGTIVAAALAGSVLSAMPQALADTATERFDGFAVETPLTHDNAAAHNWSYTGHEPYDIGIVGTGTENQLRISNAKMDSAFGDWLFSQRLDTPVTEAGGQEFVAEFQIQSATGAPQPGLQVSVAPQSADGARMSFLKFVDRGEGIDVEFADVANDGETWRQPVIDTLDYTSVHNVKIVLDLYEGPHNDVVQVYIDNDKPLIPTTLDGFQGFFAPVDKPEVAVNKAKAGQTIPLKFRVQSEVPTTFEDYYRFNGESNGDEPDSTKWTTRGVDSLVFQARGSGTMSSVLGGGYLFDNVTLTSSDDTTLPTGAAGDASIFGPKPFMTERYVCDPQDDLDVIEAYAPGETSLKYDAATGIWHYNWQTTKDSAGKCATTYLTNLESANALFKFMK